MVELILVLELINPFLLTFLEGKVSVLLESRYKHVLLMAVQPHFFIGNFHCH